MCFEFVDYHVHGSGNGRLVMSQRMEKFCKQYHKINRYVKRYLMVIGKFLAQTDEYPSAKSL